MGISYYTYAGPFIKVHNPLIDSIEEYHSCVNHKCRNHKKEISTKYCGQCGKKTKTIKRSCRERIPFDGWNKIAPNLREVLSEYLPDEPIEYEYYISNIGEFGNLFDGQFQNIKIVTPEEIQECVKKFKTKFEKAIIRIKNVFGHKNVTVEWGVLTWCS